MNLVGKIFVVLIVFMSVVFMSFAVAVNATHKNWKNVVTAPDTGLEDQLKKERQTNQVLVEERDSKTKELNAEKAASQEALTKVKNELAEVSKKYAELEKGQECWGSRSGPPSPPWAPPRITPPRATMN